MKIIISPAKRMKDAGDILDYRSRPVFLKEAQQIMRWIQQLSYKEVKNLWECSDKIAEQNIERFGRMDLYRNLIPAALAYEGIQYQYMAPVVFETEMWNYIQKHLRILSGFYGVLKPMDGVTPYRLEMRAKAKINGRSDLTEFWGSKLYEEIIDDDRVIINLASKEYSKCIENYLRMGDTYLTCVFGEQSGDRVLQKGTYAKMARGEMVRFMAENHIEKVSEIQNFDRLGYCFSRELSSETKYVFLKNMEEKK